MRNCEAHNQCQAPDYPTSIVLEKPSNITTGSQEVESRGDQAQDNYHQQAIVKTEIWGLIWRCKGSSYLAIDNLKTKLRKTNTLVTRPVKKGTHISRHVIPTCGTI